MAVALTRSSAILPPSVYYYSTPNISALNSDIKIAMEGNLPRIVQPQLDHSSSLFQPLQNYENTGYRVDGNTDFISPHSRGLDDTSSMQGRGSIAPFKPVISKNGFLIVYCYTPTEGESKVPISATVELRYPAEAASWEGQVKLRLVLGRTALTTTVRPLEVATDSRGGNAMVSRWQVSAIAPPFEKARYHRHISVPLTLQALVGRQEVLDTITFGTFSYWEPGPGAEFPEAQPSSLKRPREEEQSRETRNAPIRRSPHQPDKDARISRGSSTSSNGMQNGIYIPGRNGSQEGNQISLVSQETKLVAAHGLRESADGKVQRAVLEWVITQTTPHPDTFDKNWTSEEKELGRRLVRFHRAHESSRLLVACEAIVQDNYNERDIVISCICRPDANTYWFTSVDIIYLLERLVGASFTVEEKNRIRRNLEGFKPTTVSKSRPGFEVFFQRIMDFPVPKPRNIEKDVKVFPWAVLSPALHKILSKYSLYVGSTSAQTSPWLHSETPSGSPEGIRNSLPPQNLSGAIPSQDERPFSSHSRRSSFPHVPSQSAQQDNDSQVPVLTFPETNLHDVSDAWTRKTPVPLNQSNDRIATDGGLPSTSHVAHEVFTSAYMHSASSPFITLGEISHNGASNPGPSPDTSFPPGSTTPSTWSRSGTWVASGNSRGQNESSEIQSDNMDEGRRKDVSYDGLATAQHGNSLLLDLDAASADDIYPQYSLGTQTPIDDIIDHS